MNSGRIVNLIVIFSVFWSGSSLAHKVAGRKNHTHSIEYIEKVIEKAAKKVGVPFEVLRAICKTESNLKTDAYVYSDGGGDNHAFGMCQVLRTTAEKYVGIDKG